MLYLFAGFIVTAVWLLCLALRYRSADHSPYDSPPADLLISEEQVSAAHTSVVAKLNRLASQRSRDIDVARAQLEDLFFQEVDAQIVPVDVDGIPAEWVLAAGADPTRRLLYLHGGAFRVGSPRSHRYLTAELSRRCSVAVLCIDYRMQPEHKITHCHEDARIAYRWMIEHSPDNRHTSAAQLFVAGDSAGGNLALSLIAWLRDQQLRQVDAAVAFAPLTDASFGSPTWRTNAGSDPFLGPGLGPLAKLPRWLLAIGSRLGSGKPVNHPELSPLLGHLEHLPDTLLQVSRDEMLYGDSLRYANKANTQGSHVVLQVWPKMVHVFQAFPELSESDDALNRAAEFIRQRMHEVEQTSQGTAVLS